MSVTITMLQTRRGEDGTLWQAGTDHVASDTFAQLLITANLATGPARPLPTEPGPLSSAECTAVRALVSGGGNPCEPLLTVFSGNSISVNNSFLFSPIGWHVLSEMGHAVNFAGDCVRFLPQMATAGTRGDVFGNYGYGGAELNTITGLMNTEWFPALDGEGVSPQLVIGLALLENDVALTSNSATIIARVDAWVSRVQTKWPGAVIQLCTARPDGRLDGNAAMVAAADAVYAYVMSLDDSKRVFVTDLKNSGYLDPSTPWLPLAGYTYLSATSESLSARATGPHPRQNAATMNGRAIATTWRRIVGMKAPASVRAKSPNLGLMGSSNYFSTNKTTSTSTVPTGGTVVTAPAGATATIASTALNPGWRLVFSPSADTPADQLYVGIGQINTPPKPARYRCYAKVKINSGAAFIQGMHARCHIFYSSGNSQATSHAFNASASTDPAWALRDGDILTLYSPGLTPTAGVTIANINPYFRMLTQAVGGLPGVVDITILEIGYIPEIELAATAAIAPGASPYTYNNTQAYSVDVWISGGTVSAVDFIRDGATAISTGLTAGKVTLRPSESLKVTYTVAPTMTAVPQS